MKTKSSILAIIALIAMTLDHIGVTFFPEATALRMIGRIAFPIFVFGIVQGARYTKDIKEYLWRLLIFGTIAQIPYIFWLGRPGLNAILTLFMCLVFLSLIIQKKYTWSVVILVAGHFSNMEYGLYAMAVTMILHFMREKTLEGLLLLTITTMIYVFFTSSIMQMYSLGGFILVYAMHKRPLSVELPRSFLYYYYPLHIAALVLIRCFIPVRAYVLGL